ncbi:MAG: bacteriorhodopsin [Haloferacaceae archaeon]
MNLTVVWYLIGAVGMAIGAALASWRFVTDPPRRRYYAVLALIPGIAAAAYAAMALGLGQVATPNGQMLLPRYVDWLLTTPLLVLYLGLLCDPGRRVYVALVVVDVVIIGSGVVAGLLPRPLGWVSFGVGSLAYVGLLYLLLSVLPRQAALDHDRVDAVFTKLRNLTVVLWTLYPVVWVLSPLGLGLLQTSTEALVVTYLDLLSKVGFVIIALNGSDALRSLSTAAADASRTNEAGRTAD